MSQQMPHSAVDGAAGLHAEEGAQLVPGPTAKLTRRALHQLRQEYRRQDGEPSEMSSTASPPTRPGTPWQLHRPPPDDGLLDPDVPVLPPYSESELARIEAEEKQGAENFARMMQELEERDPGIFTHNGGGAPWIPSPVRHNSEWSRDGEFQLLRDETLEAVRFRPWAPSLYHTHGNSAFTGEQASTRAPDDDYEAEVAADIGLGAGPVSAAAAATLPSDFPPHRAVDGALELGKFLASSSYIVSLGGPPLPDLRYGIVIVPVGEESMLFRGYGDHAALPPGFKEQVYAKSKEAKNEQGVEHWMNQREARLKGYVLETELDEEERDFYRQRWLARGGAQAPAEYDGEEGVYDDWNWASSSSLPRPRRPSSPAPAGHDGEEGAYDDWNRATSSSLPRPRRPSSPAPAGHGDEIAIYNNGGSAATTASLPRRRQRSLEDRRTPPRGEREARSSHRSSH